MALVEDYTIDVETTGKASTVLGYYATDLSSWSAMISTHPLPAEPAAGVSIVGTLKTVGAAWHDALDKMVGEMKGLSTTCSTSATLYHEAEETVTRTFRPSGQYTSLTH